MAHCLSADPLSEADLKGRRGVAMGRYVGNTNEFQKRMLDVPCTNQCCCCVLGASPCAHVCVQMKMLHKVLNHLTPGSGWEHYQCCQGYMPACCCFTPGECGERDYPRTCMCVEAWCCPGLAVSTTRYLMMDHYDLAPDPCDNRLIRCNNCIQLLSCVCYCLAAFDRSFEDLAQLVDCLAEVVFWSTAGCMVAQVNHEIEFRDRGSAVNADGEPNYSPLAAPLEGDVIAVEPPAAQASMGR